MSQAAMNQILSQINQFSKEELSVVDQAVHHRLSPNPATQQRDSLFNRLLASGLVLEIKKPAPTEPLETPLHEWPGKPLSETIIEERR